MRKYVIWMLGGMLFLLAGCGNTEDKSKKENELAKAYVLYENGNYEEAKDIFQDYTEIEECKESAWIGSGKCSEQLGMTEEALEAYSVVLESDPENINCLYNRAILYEQAGDQESAYKDYEVLYTLNPEDNFAWGKVESYLQQNGQLEVLLQKYQSVEKDGDESILAKEIEILAALEREEEIPDIINRFDDEDFRQLCTKQLEAYKNIKKGNMGKAKEILFSYENFSEEDIRSKSVYMGEHNDFFQREGIGILITNEYIDTQVYIGEWKAGKREGTGTAFCMYLDDYDDEFYKEMDILEGFWEDDLPNGTCQHTEIVESFDQGKKIYGKKEIYTAAYVEGCVNGELFNVKILREYDDGTQIEDERKLMVEQGISVPFFYDGKEIYSIEYDQNGNIDYLNDDWSVDTWFKWDVH